MQMGKRALSIYVLLIFMFTGMICRFYLLSVAGDSLASVANNQSTFVLDVDNTRGMIYDCNMKPLVANERKTVAAVLPSPEAYTALTAAARETGDTIEPDTDATRPYTVELKQTEVYSKGIEMFETVQRYSKNQLAPHIIGYLSPDKKDGAAGIELAYNDLLRQYDGNLQVRYTMDAVGRTMTTAVPEIRKNNYRSEGGVVLTLDAEIQRAAQDAMRGVEKGAAVVMDVQTGDLKASVSMPAYDPNNLAASLHDERSPFVNRAFSQYNVGSTFKLVTAAAALESGVGRYAPYLCEGYVDVDGHIFHCHWRNGHGEIDLKKAIEVSCNPFFIHMGQVAGGKRIVSLAREIGFTRAAQFSNDIRTRSGTLPDERELELNTAVANLSFGQGSLTATPIQIAQMICTVANGGFAVTPRLVEGFTENGKDLYEHTLSYHPSQVFSEYISDVLRDTLVANVVDGSGKLAAPSYSTAGGKTASAQTGIYETPGEEDSEIVHAWFAGYVPAEQPKYAIVVLVENGKSGSDVAAPIFKEIADGIYLAQHSGQAEAYRTKEDSSI